MCRSEEGNAVIPHISVTWGITFSTAIENSTMKQKVPYLGETEPTSKPSGGKRDMRRSYTRTMWCTRKREPRTRTTKQNTFHPHRASILYNKSVISMGSSSPISSVP